MAIVTPKINQAYGIGQGFFNLAPFTIVAQRAPGVNDKAREGTLWDFKTSNIVYMLTSFAAGQAVWTQLSNAGGAGVFSSLTVNGATQLNGSLTQVAGAVSLGADATGNAISIGTGLAARTITIGNTTGATGLGLSAGTNGITLNASAVTVTVAGSFRIVPPVLTPADTFVTETINAYSGSVRFNNAATWIALPGALLPNPFVITNSGLTANAAVLVTIQTEGSTPANNMLRVAQVLIDTVANTMTIYVVNDAAATGASDCTRCIVNFIVMRP